MKKTLNNLLFASTADAVVAFLALTCLVLTAIGVALTISELFIF